MGAGSGVAEAGVTVDADMAADVGAGSGEGPGGSARGISTGGTGTTGAGAATFGAGLVSGRVFGRVSGAVSTTFARGLAAAFRTTLLGFDALALAGAAFPRPAGFAADLAFFADFGGAAFAAGLGVFAVAFGVDFPADWRRDFAGGEPAFGFAAERDDDFGDVLTG